MTGDPHFVNPPEGDQQGTDPQAEGGEVPVNPPVQNTGENLENSASEPDNGPHSSAVPAAGAKDSPVVHVEPVPDASPEIPATGGPGEASQDTETPGDASASATTLQPSVSSEEESPPPETPEQTSVSAPAVAPTPDISPEQPVASVEEGEPTPEVASDQPVAAEMEAEEDSEISPEPPQPKDPARPRLHIGSAYYPEQWPEERWQVDIDLMKDLGLTVARLGEFAWSTMQPSAGRFDFQWLRRVIDKLAAADIATVLGTPTASPPAWLCEAYPDLMAVEEDGHRVQFGNRAHYCVNSPAMHTATKELVGRMAAALGSHPAVIGWQIDNEFSRVCYCDTCRKAFQAFLEQRYGSLEVLNERWATAYWSQTYSAWDQIPLPIGPHNPALRLAHKHFITESYCRFQQMQIDLIRPQIADTVWITHNTMKWHGGFDHYQLHENLDMASWDWYVGSGHNDPLTSGAAHDLVRGYKRRNYWVMETQPGHVNWAGINNDLHKGEGRAMAWQAVSHGADGFLYWQWRSAPNGQEQLHGTLVDQSGELAPFSEEVRRIAREFAQVSDLLIPSEVKAKIAILNDYPSRWLIDWQPHHEDYEYVEHLLRYYAPIAAQNVPIDIISADAPLDGYRLVVVPAMVVVDEARRDALYEYMTRNGYLLITQRSGLRDHDNRSYEQRPPSLLTEIAGVEVRQGFVLDEPVRIKGNWFDGDAHIYAELLNITDTSITIPAAKYGSDHSWLKDTPAITVHGYRGGLAYYVGVVLDDEAQETFMARVVKNSGQKAVLDVPRGVQASRRMRPDGNEVIILVNHAAEVKRIPISQSFREHLRDLTLSEPFDLAPYGVAVLTRIPETTT